MNLLREQECANACQAEKGGGGPLFRAWFHHDVVVQALLKRLKKQRRKHTAGWMEGGLRISTSSEGKVAP